MKKARSANNDSGLSEILNRAEQVIKTARKHKQPLTGSGFYAKKHATTHAEATLALRELTTRCSELLDGKLAPKIAELEKCVQLFFAPESTYPERVTAKQRCDFLLKTEFNPILSKRPVLPSDSFFPLEILAVGNRNYIRRTAEQACGNYDCGWYDGAAVMARKLLETLIIEAYEAKGLDCKLKKADGNFHYLSVLIDILLSETAFNVSRNTKSALPKLKDLGDQSAHNRRYIARQSDLDKIKRELRITLEELVHLAGFDGAK